MGITRAVPVNAASEALLEKNGFYNPSPGAGNSEWRLHEETTPSEKFGENDVRVSTRVPSAVGAGDAHTKPMDVDLASVLEAPTKGKVATLAEKLVDTV